MTSIKKIYYWPSLDFHLYAAGHAVAVAESFGRAVDIVMEQYPDVDKNILYSSHCEEIELDENFSLLFMGWN